MQDLQLASGRPKRAEGIAPVQGQRQEKRLMSQLDGEVKQEEFPLCGERVRFLVHLGL